MTDRTTQWLQRRLDALAPLDAGDHAAIAALQIIERTYEPGQYILREGDRPKYCTFLTRGFVYRHKLVGDGGRAIVAIHIAGDLVDAQQVMLAQADHNVQALTEATMLCIANDALIALAAARPQIARALWHDTLVMGSITREWLAGVGRRDARTRMAHLLCELSLRSEQAGIGPRQTFELPMTQEQLGDALGLTSVHVNRTLKTLEADGLVVRSKRTMAIADWKRLRDAGDFSSAYLHLGDPPELR